MPTPLNDTIKAQNQGMLIFLLAGFLLIFVVPGTLLATLRIEDAGTRTMVGLIALLPLVTGIGLAVWGMRVWLGRNRTVRG